MTYLQEPLNLLRSKAKTDRWIGGHMEPLDFCSVLFFFFFSKLKRHCERRKFEMLMFLERALCIPTVCFFSYSRLSGSCSLLESYRDARNFLLLFPFCSVFFFMLDNRAYISLRYLAMCYHRYRLAIPA